MTDGVDTGPMSSQPQPPPPWRTSSSNNNLHPLSSDLSLSAAADIIKSLDTAFSNMNHSALTAARDAEEARANARAASEIVRRFRMQQQQQTQNMDESKGAGNDDIVLPPQLFGLGSPQENASGLFYHHHHAYHPTPPAMHKSPQSKWPLGSSPTANSNGSSSTTFQWTSSSSAATSSLERSEDVLRLTLELQRVNQQLEAESLAHEDTKLALKRALKKQDELQQHMEKMLDDMERQRESAGRDMDSLEHDLAAANARAALAEEDAEMALDIAKTSTDSKIQLENQLESALRDIQILQEQNAQLQQANRSLRNQRQQQKQQQSSSSASMNAKHSTSNVQQPAAPSSQSGGGAGRHVRFADNPTFFEEASLEKKEPSTNLPQQSSLSSSSSSSSTDSFASPPRPNRSLIAAGRQLLSSHLSPSKEDSIFSLSRSLIQDSAERRQRLTGRLQELDQMQSEQQEGLATMPMAPQGGHATTFTDVVSTGSTTTTTTLDVHSSEALQVCRKAAEALKDSGKRLNLPGRHWTQDVNGTSPFADVLHLDVLAKQYCNAVEVCLDENRKQLVELESLCSLWEQGTVSSSSSSNNRTKDSIGEAASW